MRTFITLSIIIVLILLGSAGGFFAGKASKNIKTIDDFSISLHQVQDEMRVLQSNFSTLTVELAKKTGITFQQSNFNLEAALAKTDALIQQGELAKAALYFSNTLAQSPNHFQTIEHYQQTVLAYCQQLNQQGNYEMVLDILTDMDNFLRMQAMAIKPQFIDKLEKILTEIADFRQTVETANTTRNNEETLKFVRELINNSGQLLKQQPKPDISNMTEYLEKLKDKLLTLQSIDTNIFQKTELVTLNNTTKQLSDKIASVEPQLAVIQKQSMVSEFVQQINTLFKKVKAESTESPLILYYLTLIDSLLNQLVLIAPDTQEMQIQLANFSKELDLVKENLAKTHSQAVWHDIEKLISTQLVIDKDSKAQDAIIKLVQLRQLFAEKANGLTSLEFLEKAKALRDQIENAIVDWQNKQVHKYNQFAIGRIKNLYESYKNQLGANTDEEIVYNATIELLGLIDTRYLSTAAMTGYNEVFGKFYAELDDEQKISLSSEMTLKTKKPLTDF